MCVCGTYPCLLDLLLQPLTLLLLLLHRWPDPRFSLHIGDVQQSLDSLTRSISIDTLSQTPSPFFLYSLTLYVRHTSSKICIYRCFFTMLYLFKRKPLLFVSPWLTWTYCVTIKAYILPSNDCNISKWEVCPYFGNFSGLGCNLLLHSLSLSLKNDAM